MPLELYLAYIAACAAIAIIPGPMVALVVANSLRYGTRAGLLNVAGAQLGLALMIAALAVGLASIVALVGWCFDALRLAGAAYLVWLGWKLLRGSGTAAPVAARPPRGGFFLQGFLVMMSNPKVLLFFGAFIPQFIDPWNGATGRIMLLGATAMAVAALSDSLYALLAGRAGGLLARRRLRLLSRLSGIFLIGGGLWLAAGRAR